MQDLVHAVERVYRCRRPEVGAGEAFALQGTPAARVRKEVRKTVRAKIGRLKANRQFESALLTNNVDKLVLYEPPIDVTDERIYPLGVIDRLETMLDADDRDGLVATMMHEVVGLLPETVEYLRSLPVWQARLAAAHTIPRELRASEAYRFDPKRFRALRTPTLLLIGGDSPATFRAAEEAVDEALADARVVFMPGQRHATIDTGTDLFTTEVLHFLMADRQ